MAGATGALLWEVNVQLGFKRVSFRLSLALPYSDSYPLTFSQLDRNCRDQALTSSLLRKLHAFDLIYAACRSSDRSDTKVCDAVGSCSLYWGQSFRDLATTLLASLKWFDSRLVRLVNLLFCSCYLLWDLEEDMQHQEKVEKKKKKKKKKKIFFFKVLRLRHDLL